MCLFWFVAFRVTFNDLCCWRQRWGLLSRIQLGITNQSWQTSPNECVLHFEIVFAVCWHQIGNLIQVDCYTVPLILLKVRQILSKVCGLMTLKQIFQLKSIPCVYLHDIWIRLLARVCFDASFMCLSRIVSFRVTFNDLCCWTQRRGLLSGTHFKGNGPILTDWSKWICNTLWSCFCALLTSTWEFSTSRLHYSFNILF